MDPFAAKRTAMRDEFFAKLFLLGGWLGGTDTYKRTMWAAVPDVALARAGYALTLRKGLPEPGTDNQLIMAGHEAMLAQWFHRPLRRADIELAGQWFEQHAAVKAFPQHLWDTVLAGQPGDDIVLPIDVWGFAGGQTFLPGVPCLFFEGPGGLVSYLEPAMCRYFAPVIQATKARLMKLATPRDAEFGLRSAPVEVCNLILLLARYVGGGGQLTSNDTAEFLYPELFRSIGTIGHEMMCAAQTFERSLGDAEYEMMDRFVSAMGQASLLCDLVDAETVGLENALRVLRAHPETERVGIRVDSGDIAEQCVLYFRRMRSVGISPRLIVFEDEVTPEVVQRVYQHFRQETGEEPTMLFPGAGGYWWRLVHRDTVAAAFKRSATGDHPNVKFSNSPGKESLGGYLRVFGRGDALVVADASETIDGEPLFVKLVEQGRIVYRESFPEQAQRADRTWGRYRRVELSPSVQEYRDRFRGMRKCEVAVARKHLEDASMNDEEQILIAEAKAGGQTARNALFAQAVESLGRLAVFKTGNRFDQSGRDLLQETTARGLDHFSSWKGTTVVELRGWLRQIFLHLIQEKWRREGVRHAEPLPPDVPDDATSIVTRVVTAEDKKRYNEAFNKLDPFDQALIRLRNEGMSFKEIAAALDLKNEDQARYLHSCAVRHLRELLGEQP